MNKPWSKIRKELEQDFLCDSLKGRVRYYTTLYSKFHNSYGRVCVLVDNVEKINMHCFTQNSLNSKVRRIYEKNTDKSRGEIYNELEAENHENRIFISWDFVDALDEFFTNSIDKSLSSSNYLVRMLAIFNLRTGKRMLEKLKPTVSELPEWLQYFYNLRLESEGV